MLVLQWSRNNLQPQTLYRRNKNDSPISWLHINVPFLKWMMCFLCIYFTPYKALMRHCSGARTRNKHAINDKAKTNFFSLKLISYCHLKALYLISSPLTRVNVWLQNENWPLLQISHHEFLQKPVCANASLTHPANTLLGSTHDSFLFKH